MLRARTLCLTFLALTSLQDHCAVVLAFKLSDLEFSMSRDDFSVPFDKGEAGAPRNDLTGREGREGGRAGPGLALLVSTADNFTLSSSPREPGPNREGTHSVMRTHRPLPLSGSYQQWNLRGPEAKPRDSLKSFSPSH